ncbi:hypothetical protein J2P12_08685, partial [Candidatus Bathyarchaeota archaeon]|nr:hypothetical protein [Candidatus Bathyarchaeota archaeon]
MAREFDDLRSRSDPGYVVMASSGQRYKQSVPFDERFGDFPVRPSQDLIRRRFQDELIRQEYEKGGPGLVSPGYQERLGDETKVISSNLPPSLNQSNAIREALPRAEPTPDILGTGAGALPVPEPLGLIERLLQDQRRRQGIPGKQGLEDLQSMQLAGDVIPMRTPGSVDDRLIN